MTRAAIVTRAAVVTREGDELILNFRPHEILDGEGDFRAGTKVSLPSRNPTFRSKPSPTTQDGIDGLGQMKAISNPPSLFGFGFGQGH